MCSRSFQCPRSQVSRDHHFQWPWVTSNPDFKMTILFNVKKLGNSTRQTYTYNSRPIESHRPTWFIERRHFSDLERPLTHISRSRHYLTLSISERVRDTDIVTMKRNLRRSQEYHFECPWVILSDLAKYSMTRSIARSLNPSRHSKVYR